MKKVSVILPSYNYAEELHRCIESVLTQTFSDWELIIVDDGSTDNSAEVIRSYVNKYPDKIYFFEHEEKINKGLSKTYQMGISKASGEYIALLEADDYWRLDSLELKAGILERYPEVSVAYTDIEMFGSKKMIQQINRDIQSWELPEDAITGKPYHAFGYLLDQNLVLTCSAFMTRKNLLSEANLLSPYDAWFDWWILAQLSLRGKFYKCSEKATFWQLRSKSYLHEFNKSINIRKESRFFLRHLFFLMSGFLYTTSSECQRPEYKLIAKEIRRRKFRHKLFRLETILPVPAHRIWIIVVKSMAMVWILVVKQLAKVWHIIAMITHPVRKPLKNLWKFLTKN